MKFQNRLKLLGFASYGDYLASETWKAFRQKYKNAGLRMICQVCNGRPIQLHHCTYERLGNELLEDVMPLCRPHHEAVHAWLKSSGRIFVEFTREAVKALGGESVSPQQKKPKRHGPSRKTLKTGKTGKQRKKEHREKIKEAAKNRAAVSAPYLAELDGLLDRKAISPKAHKSAKTCGNVNSILAVIASGRRKIAARQQRKKDIDEATSRKQFPETTHQGKSHVPRSKAVGATAQPRNKSDWLTYLENRKKGNL